MASLDATKPTASIALDDQCAILAQQNALSLNTLITQNMANTNNAMFQIATGAADNSSFLRARAQEAYLNGQQLLGSVAANNLMSQGNAELAKSILGQRSVENQPQQSPSFVTPVVLPNPSTVVK